MLLRKHCLSSDGRDSIARPKDPVLVFSKLLGQRVECQESLGEHFVVN